jgi:hypothetical protein
MRHRGIGERTENGARHVEHFLRRTIRNAERLDLDAAHSEIVEDLLPILETRIEMNALGRVACERRRSVDETILPLLRNGANGVQEDREIDRREILRLVDEEVLVRERDLALPELAANLLIDAKEKRVVFDVELRALVAADRFVVGAQLFFVLGLGRIFHLGRGFSFGAIAGIELDHGRAAIGAPSPSALQVGGPELGIGRGSECRAERLVVGEDLGPETDRPTRVFA